MELLFRLSAYDDPALDGETAQLMDELLEAKSRSVMPGLWRLTDWLDGYAAKGPGSGRRGIRYRVYEAVLLALGVFLLIPGLTDPKGLSVPLAAGALGTALGLVLLLSPGRRRPSGPSSQARKAAAELLARMRGLDGGDVCVRFDRSGMACLERGQAVRTAPWSELTHVSQSRSAWLVGWGESGALLLQKKDLAAGDAEGFFSRMEEDIVKRSRHED